MALCPAVFLDRDGVITRTFIRDGRPKPPARLEELEIMPGAAEALTRLRAAGFQLIVVTNQPDVSRATTTREAVQHINQRMSELVRLDSIYTCFHDDIDGCQCRKPRPGMLLQAADDWNIDLSASVMVGDRWSDIRAGQAAGCRTNILINRGYSQSERCRPDATVDNLSEAVELILEGRKQCLLVAQT